MRWITRRNVKVDRVACPWLIKRFIDPRAEFLFVPEEELLERARQEDAIPFDATRCSEVSLNHRGERCTFEAILEDYKLTDPALHRLGLIVRGADVKGQEKHSLESPGLRAIAQGFALCVSSDEERLTQEFPIYDALLEYVRHQMCFNRRGRSASSPPDLWRFFR
ncbi:MAG TPA: chromate resistance protein ChrB domain-containing protein [Terriglobia bacterium]|nr:chromate resistance protein ChrB domain-containing protein [Terriglobia bacterium]